MLPRIPMPDDMTTRREDQPESAHPIHITREIPLWGLLSVLGALAAQAIALYYSNDSLTKTVAAQSLQLTTVATDIRTISTELNRAAVRSAGVDFQITDLQRRLAALELQASTVRVAK